MRVEDIVAVTATIDLYAVALDSHRYDLFDRVFTECARTDFGGSAALVGRASLKENFAAIHAPFHSTQQIISGQLRACDGSVATLWRLQAVRLGPRAGLERDRGLHEYQVGVVGL